MPQLQVISGREETPNAAQENLEKFFTKLGKDYTDEQDRVKIGSILDKYEQNQGDAKAWEKAYLDVERSNISPTRRLQATESLNKMKDRIIEQDKALNAQVKKLETESNKEKAADALRKSGATEEQISLYEASPVGGQTKIVENIVEQQSRQKAPPGIVPEDIVDYDKGLTPKERVKRQDARYAVQTPLVMKNSEALHGLENESMSIGLLQELDASGKVGEGVHNLNINPKTGDLIIPKLATAEEQLFVKTVNDFTVKAKDSFGARVTNFELDRFMQRLPTLANSQEGRQLIMRQMQIVNQINQLEKKELQKVFDQYGVRNIDYADAENKARDAIKEDKEVLRKEYLNLEQLAKKHESETIKNMKDKVQEGYTAMRKPDGTIKQFPTKNVPNLEEKGYQRL
jgi:hypothetical protein